MTDARTFQAVPAPRQIRSERREAIQAVLAVFCQYLDPFSRCVGLTAPDDSFISLDMKGIVLASGLERRRCERAIGNLKDTGFMEVKQPRFKNGEGRYFGLRAIRLLTVRFFEWLGLGPMLARERVRASKALKARLTKYGRNLADAMKRKMPQSFKVLPRLAGLQRIRPKPLARERLQAWNRLLMKYVDAGLEIREAQRQANAEMNFPPDWSPGKGAPEEL